MKKVLSFLFLIIIGGGLTYTGYNEWQDSKKLAAKGKSTIGKVTHHYTHKARKGSRKYNLVVAFETENQEARKKTIRVDSSVYYSASSRGTVQVHYLPNDPDVVQAGSKVEIEYGSFVLGLVFLGFGVGVLALYGGSAVFYKGSAKAISKGVQVLSEMKSQYRTVDGREFKHLDLGFYDYGRRELEAQGFVFLEDTEDALHKGPRVFFRTLVGPDGGTLGILYHYKLSALLRLLGGKDSKVMEFETGFSNGLYVFTSNAEDAGTLDSPEVIDALWMPHGTALPLVHRAHEKRLQAFREKYPGVEPVPVKTAADLHRFQTELDRIKSEFRKRHGLSKGELQRIAGQDGSEAMLILHKDVAKDHAQRQKAA